MLTKQQERDVLAASEALAGWLCDAVEATVEERSAEVAREAFREVVELERPSLDPAEDPVSTVMIIVLIHLVDRVREQLADRPEAIEEILAWIEVNLGKRYRLRARYVAVALRSAEGIDEAGEYAPALAGDFVPSMIWLLAGAVACCGDGDLHWLRRLWETSLAR